MKEKKAGKGKKTRVVVKDLQLRKAKGGADSEDPKGGFNPNDIPSVRTRFDPQPEPPGISGGTRRMNR